MATSPPWSLSARITTVILPVLCGVCLIAGPTSLAEAARPNVLFLFADDMRADSIAALGDRQVITPRLDRLVERGFVFRNAYCLGSDQPAVCLPSRNMLLSGDAYFRWRNPSDGRKPLPAADPAGPNFPRVFREAGYATYHYGKRGNTAPAIQALFEVNQTLADDEGERRSGEPGKLIVDDAITFLERDRGGRPFCMYLAFGNPHDPRVAAPEYLAQYDPEALQPWPNVLPQHPFDNGEMTVRDELLLPWPRTPEALRKTQHEYYATITGLDAHIGRLLAKLDELGLTENTVIAFSADHGIAVGGHGLLGKQNLYEHSMKAPLVFAGPGVPRGSSDALLYLHDIGATLCELAGLAPPAGRDGQSAAAVVRGEREAHRPELLLAYRDVQRAYRDRRWKLIRYPRVDVTQLFDLEADPFEWTNLADAPEHQPRVQALRERMERAQRALGDSLAWTAPTVQPAAWKPPTEGSRP